MLTIKKQEISNLLILEYLASLHTVHEKVRLFENKYHTSWKDFSQNLQSSDEEDMQQWDDYIEWKAYMKLADELDKKINEVKRGHFEIS